MPSSCSGLASRPWVCADGGKERGDKVHETSLIYAAEFVYRKVRVRKKGLTIVHIFHNTNRL